nr:MAG TPA: hypothetical protein [Caudoviricetes sp.]
MVTIRAISLGSMTRLRTYIPLCAVMIQTI